VECVCERMGPGPGGSDASCDCDRMSGSTSKAPAAAARLPLHLAGDEQARGWRRLGRRDGAGDEGPPAPTLGLETMVAPLAAYGKGADNSASRPVSWVVGNMSTTPHKGAQG